jgi:hypothetical protein
MRNNTIYSWKLRVSFYLKREWLKNPCPKRLNVLDRLDSILKELQAMGE